MRDFLQSACKPVAGGEQSEIIFTALNTSISWLTYTPRDRRSVRIKSAVFRPAHGGGSRHGATHLLPEAQNRRAARQHPALVPTPKHVGGRSSPASPTLTLVRAAAAAGPRTHSAPQLSAADPGKQLTWLSISVILRRATSLHRRKQLTINLGINSLNRMNRMLQRQVQPIIIHQYSIFLYLYSINYGKSSHYKSCNHTILNICLMDTTIMIPERIHEESTVKTCIFSCFMIVSTASKSNFLPHFMTYFLMTKCKDLNKLMKP